jgi:glycylpeptide N-tetradecanoyltransferase
VLRDNYVEDDDNMFRFAYSERFLLWALTPPGYAADWHVGVRDCRGGKELAAGKLVAVITGVPAQMRIHGAALPLCEINFLCVHKALRAKRLAPLLIKEVTRRVNLRGVWQAAYTAGVVLPKPVASCQYWHRSLDPKTLIDVGVSRLAPRMTMPRTLRLYALPEVSRAARRGAARRSARAHARETRCC